MFDITFTVRDWDWQRDVIDDCVNVAIYYFDDPEFYKEPDGIYMLVVIYIPIVEVVDRWVRV